MSQYIPMYSQAVSCDW